MEDMQMHLVYATGGSRRDFQIASRRDEVPTDARVYATCTQESTVENIGETTLRNMSDGEYYALKAMVREARERAARETQAEPSDSQTLRKFFGKLFSR
jgi:hypothetical protein